MPIFDAKPRSWDAYLAGIGVSGAAMASALVMFVILIGVITLKTWPQARALLDSGGAATLQTTATPAPQAAHHSTLNLVTPFGGGPAASRQAADRGATGGGEGLNPGENGGLSGGSTGPAGTGGGQSQGTEQPPSQSQQPSNAVSQTLSGAGNTVQSSTERLGNSLGGSSSPGLGGLLGGVGRTLNSDLQSLADQH
jgi:hypothetical protein